MRKTINWNFYFLGLLNLQNSIINNNVINSLLVFSGFDNSITIEAILVPNCVSISSSGVSVSLKKFFLKIFFG